MSGFGGWIGTLTRTVEGCTIWIRESGGTTAPLCSNVAISPATLSVNPPTVAAGGTLTVTGADIPAGTYTLVLHSAPVTLATVTVGADGALATTVSVPTSVPTGVHSLRLTADAGVVLAAADVTVLAGPTLAATGAETDGLTLGVLLLALGALGLWWRRRTVGLTR